MTKKAVSYSRRALPRMLVYGFILLVALSSEAFAQADVDVYLDSTAQVIRGFGAANIVGWRPDMTDEEIELAFGNGEGQLGFSILRIRIPPDEDQWAANLPTARAAHALGAKIVASPWSPPARMKTNNSLIDGRLREDMYDDYAAHLDAFNTYMTDNGVPLYALSVQNEPDIDVDYESCHWSPEEMLRFMRENASSIGTRVMAPESFQFRRAMSDPLLQDSVAAANLDMVAGHIYGGGNAAYPLAQEVGKELWMTEYLLLDMDLETDIEAARTIQTAMKAGMSAYIWWYLVRFYGPISDDESDVYEKGEVTRRGYFFSQFSKFIRPGYVRVHTADPLRPQLRRALSTTAYTSGNKAVIVAINGEAEPLEVNFALQGGSATSFSRYTTSETQNVEKLDDVPVSDGSFTAVLGGHSVTTFVAEDFTTVSNEEVASPPSSYQLVQNYPNPFTSATIIGYTVLQTVDVTLDVFDLLGRKVATLVNGRVSAGSHQMIFDASQLPAGVYVYRLKAGDVVQTRRMTLIE